MKDTYPISKRIYVKLFPYLYRVVHFFGQDAYVKKYNRKIYFDPNTDIGQKLLRVGNFERAELSIIEKFISEKSIVIDIGANIGTYTLFFANIAKQGKVFSFEPSKETFALLLRNIRNLKNITPVNVAVSNANGTAVFYNAIDNAYSGLKKTGKKVVTAVENVSIIRLDDYPEFTNLTHIDFIKIDVEGNEEEVIDGALKTLIKYKPIILIEISSGIESNPNPGKTIAKITALGYTPYIINGWDTEPFLQLDGKEHNYIFISK